MSKNLNEKKAITFTLLVYVAAVFIAALTMPLAYHVLLAWDKFLDRWFS